MSKIQNAIDKAGAHDEDLDSNVLWVHDNLVQGRDFCWEVGTLTTLSDWGLGIALITEPAWGAQYPNKATLEIHIGPWHLYLHHAWGRGEGQRD